MSLTILTSIEDMYALWDGATDAGGWLPVVLDGYNMPWILYETEAADHFAHTVPSDDPQDVATLTWEKLLEEQHGKHLRVIWDGRP